MSDKKEKVYPSWRYHKTLEPKIVHSEEHDEELGSGWADSPAAHEEKAPAKTVAPKEDEKSEVKESKKALKK